MQIALLLSAQSPVVRQLGSDTMCFVGPGTSSEFVSSQTTIDRVFRKGDSTTAASIVAGLTGTFDVVQITTEGASSPTVERFTFHVFPTDSIGARRCPQFTCPGSQVVLIAGYKGQVLSVADSMRVVQGALRSSRVYVLQYFPSFQRKVYLADVTASDGGGDFLLLDEITPTGFRGRWEDGGMSGVALVRDGVHVLEKRSGYYCARRRE